MNTSHNGVHLIEQFEGFRADQYLDSVGVPTVGFGTTAADVSPLPQHVTVAQAEAFLKDHLARKYEPAVNGLGVPLNQNQFDALVSLAYNVGPGVMSWQIGRDLRARNYKAASADFMHYVYAGGQRLQGLVNRRLAEQRLFDTPWVDPDPHHYSRFDGTVRELGNGHRGSERDLVREYDEKRKHPHLPGRRARMATLRTDMAYLAGRLDTFLAHNDPDNEKYHRKFRRDGLLARSEGRKVL